MSCKRIAQPWTSLIHTGCVTYLALAVSATAWEPALTAATFYVSATGSDANSGSQTAPWRTVQKAANTVAAGDTVLVGEGTYPEWVATKTGGTAGNPITFAGVNSPLLGGFAIEHPYYVIQGFKMNGTNILTWEMSTVWLGLNSSSSIIAGNRFENTCSNVAQIRMSHVDGVNRPIGISISNNVFLDSSVNCITLEGTGHIVHGNHFEKTAALIPGYDSDGDMIRLLSRNTRITGNYATNWYQPIPSAHCDLIQAFSNNGEIATNNLIEGNFFINCIGCQVGNISDDGGTGRVADWTWRNNIWANVTDAMSMFAPRFRFFNNVFYRSGTNTTGPLIFRSDSANAGSGENGEVYNNIFFECGAYGATNPNIGWYALLGVTNFQADYNLVVGVGSGSMKEGFQAKGQEAHSLNGEDPRFLNATSYDFRLSPTSPCLKAGTNLSQLFNSDFLGRPRGPLWDIGAYQSSPASGGVPPLRPTGLSILRP